MNDILFVEKQYLGLNRMSLISRMSLSIFCFIAYYWRSNHQKEGDLYFFIGIGIIIISIILLFILHFVTKVENRSIILEGLWTKKILRRISRHILRMYYLLLSNSQYVFQYLLSIYS